MKFVYINLRRKKDRAKTFVDTIFERVEACDGLKLKEDKYRKIWADKVGIDEAILTEKWLMNRSNFKTLSNKFDYVLKRVGCYLSHLYALIMAEEQPILILEDDAQALQQVTKESLNNLLKDTEKEITFLGCAFHGYHKYDLTNPFINITTQHITGAFSYYVKNPKNIVRVLKSVFQENKKSYDKNKDWYSGKIKMRMRPIDEMYLLFNSNNMSCFLMPLIYTHPYEANNSDINNQGKAYEYKKLAITFYPKQLTTD